MNTTDFISEYQQLIEAQRQFFNSHATKSLDFRRTQLKKLKSVLMKHEEAMHEAIFADFGKSKFENQLTELFHVYNEIDMALRHLPNWVKRRTVSTNLLNFPARSFTQPEPLGVSLVMSAWNFPFNLSLIPMVGSMAAGNTTIVKPSELPVRCSKILAEIINSNFDPEYLHVVEGGIPETTALLKQRFDKIFFTGSPRVGKIVYRAGAEHLTNITLELGGKSPALLAADCAVGMSAKRLIWAKFVNSGQVCLTADYALAHKDIKDAFLKRAVKEIERANFSIENNNYTQIINEHHFDRLVNLIDPKKVYYGGQFDREQRLIHPTLLTDVSLDDPVMQEEIFGPILPVITVETIDEAFEIIHRFEKPLAGYLFTQNRKLKKRFLREVPFGSGSINDCLMQNSNPKLPFGGVGNSGLGQYHGKYSFDCFSHQKAILDKPTFLETNLKYYGYNKRNTSIIRKLF